MILVVRLVLDLFILKKGYASLVIFQAFLTVINAKYKKVNLFAPIVRKAFILIRQESAKFAKTLALFVLPLTLVSSVNQAILWSLLEENRPECAYLVTLKVDAKLVYIQASNVLLAFLDAHSKVQNVLVKETLGLNLSWL